MGYTPGPWIVELRGIHEWQGTTIRPESEPHALATFHGLPSGFGEPYYDADANARLGAAAPELLEACKTAEPWITEVIGLVLNPETKKPFQEDTEMLLTLRAAIAKAEGK